MKVIAFRSGTAAFLSGLLFPLALMFSPIADAQNIAVVNGKAIPKSRSDAFIRELERQGQKNSPQLQEMVKQELISREIFVQEAEKRGLAASAEVRSQLEQARQQVLISALVQDHLKKDPVKEEDIKAEYERFRKEQSDKEYRARHILVEREDQAKAIIDQLKKGAKFEELAKQSKDTGSAQRGGDLDWASPGSFVKPFSEAMVKLEKGRTTESPVQTQFGWHVIRLDDVRDAKVPGIEELRPQITEALQRRKLAQFQQDLRGRAKIE